MIKETLKVVGLLSLGLIIATVVVAMGYHYLIGILAGFALWVLLDKNMRDG